MDAVNISKLSQFARRQNHIVGTEAQACHHFGHQQEGRILGDLAQTWVDVAKGGEKELSTREWRDRNRQAFYEQRAAERQISADMEV